MIIQLEHTIGLRATKINTCDKIQIIKYIIVRLKGENKQPSAD